MREYLFRGRRFDNIWVEGYLFAKPILEKYFITLGEEQWLVNRNTVGQYTGLKDINKQKIFEGDIIRSRYGITWLVAFENNAFVCKDSSGEIYFALWEQWEFDYKNKQWLAPDYFEVVGNIYDTPELLK